MRMFLSLWLVVCGVASAQLTPCPASVHGNPVPPFLHHQDMVRRRRRRLGLHDHGPLGQPIVHCPRTQRCRWSMWRAARSPESSRGCARHMPLFSIREGYYGYISDGPADMVRVFDRRNFQVVASIPTGPSPRSMALDPTSGLLFVVGSQATASRKPNQRNSARNFQANSAARVRSARAAAGWDGIDHHGDRYGAQDPACADCPFRKPWIRAG